jgi:hypothetical protein
VRVSGLIALALVDVVRHGDALNHSILNEPEFTERSEARPAPPASDHSSPTTTDEPDLRTQSSRSLLIT